jgi:hypothetical protein
MIDAEDLELIHFVDSPETAFALLKKILDSEKKAPTPGLARSRTPHDPPPKP